MKKHFFSLRERGLFLLLLGLFLSFSSYAQDITVKGVVKDSKFGDPIIGASVLVKGTTNGTISDMDGNDLIRPAAFKYEKLIHSERTQKLPPVE